MAEQRVKFECRYKLRNGAFSLGRLSMDFIHWNVYIEGVMMNVAQQVSRELAFEPYGPQFESGHNQSEMSIFILVLHWCN